MTTATSTVPPGADTTERRRWLMLAVLITGQFMALLDVTIVNVAIPTIRTKLHASGAALQLIVAGYTVTYAMLLITGARLGDLRGPRRLVLAGLGIFTLASLACGLAPTTGALIAARFVQGAGAALMVPQILSVIQRQFAGAARARALGVYAATLASGAVVGQVVGGLLVSADLLGASWRPVFLVNVPVGLVAAALVPRLVPADHVSGGRRLDLPGLVTASGAVLLVVLPLVLGHEQGWPVWSFLSLAAGVLLACVFVQVERSVAARGGDPLLDLGVLRAPGLVAGLAALTAAMIGYGGFLFTLALHLQLGLGDSALRAGLTFAPGALAFGATGYWWRRLPGR
ncbi:MAG TPA: MFS transporter, partial [Actinomycetota bacterium]|nr:MFS transporter [Actinomycetota bacterium]